jgi:flavin reductase (DIM6/NTAB) family NADH-FMN oxidoreductase RutF
MKKASLKKIWANKYPERVALVTVWDEKNNRTNIIPLGWFTQVSEEPPLVAICVGGSNYSHQLLKKEKEFGFALASAKMGEEVLFCGTHSGKEFDKFKETKLKSKRGKLIKASLIKEAVISLECRVVRRLDFGDHSLFIGQILAGYANPTEKKILLNLGQYHFSAWPDNF